MPALSDTNEISPPITRYPATPRARPIHPSPTVDGLALEVMSGKEIGYHGQRFGIDRPYLMVQSGWGEWLPLVDT